ncbi:hypothetical protein Tco_1161780 [Tanacetum coccineum]
MKRLRGLMKRMNEKGVDLSKSEVIKEESKEEVQEEDNKISYQRIEDRVEDLNVVYQLVMDKYQDEIPEGFDRLDWIIVSWKLHSSSGIHTLVTGTCLVIHMLVEKKYPLRKEVLMHMLKLKLESEEENTMALELIKFVKKILAELESEEHKNWLVHKQTACELAIPEQTATGKGTSNPLMAGSLPKTTKPT